MLFRKVRTAAETQTALGDLNNAYSNNDAAMIGERLLGSSRANELEADRAGFYNMFKAGYNPEAALKWESNWIKMPPKRSALKSAAFDVMKVRIKASRSAPLRDRNEHRDLAAILFVTFTVDLDQVAFL